MFWGNQSLRESPVPGLSEWKVLEETPKACLPFLLPSSPPSPGHIPVPATPLSGGCFHHRWGNPKEGGWRLEPQHWETWRPWGFSKVLQPRGSTSFGCNRHCFTVGGPPGSGGCGPVQRGAGTPGPRGRAHWLVHPPQLRQPHDSPRLQGCASSPGHQGPRGIELAFSFCDLYFILVYK